MLLSLTGDLGKLGVSTLAQFVSSIQTSEWIKLTTPARLEYLNKLLSSMEPKSADLIDFYSLNSAHLRLAHGTPHTPAFGFVLVQPYHLCPIFSSYCVTNLRRGDIDGVYGGVSRPWLGTLEVRQVPHGLVVRFL